MLTASATAVMLNLFGLDTNIGSPQPTPEAEEIRLWVGVA